MTASVLLREKFWGFPTGREDETGCRAIKENKGHNEKCVLVKNLTNVHSLVSPEITSSQGGSKAWGRREQLKFAFPSAGAKAILWPELRKGRRFSPTNM